MDGSGGAGFAREVGWSGNPGGDGELASGGGFGSWRRLTRSFLGVKDG